MNKKEIIKIFYAFIWFVGICLLIAIGVALLLRTPLLASQKAFLYRLLLLTALCCMLLLALDAVVFLKRESVGGINFSSSVLCIGLATLFMSLFFSLGPMTIERSYTVFSLADMAEHPTVVYSPEEIKNRFIEGYIEGAQESQKRIDEQVYIGNMEETDGGYQITEKGVRLIKLMRFVESIFPVPDENSIYPNGK